MSDPLVLGLAIWWVVMLVFLVVMEKRERRRRADRRISPRALEKLNRQ